MIDVTVKTLDSKVKNYSVDDSITVKEFKERISGSVGVPAERQRLIFRGKVLNDDKDLNQNGPVHGKVLHLVERLPVPNNTSTRTAATSGSSSTSSGAQSHGGPSISQLMSSSPSGFTIRGSDHNDVVHQVLQEALSGMGATGASMVHGTVRPNHSNNGTEQRMDIRIQFGSENSSTTGTRNPTSQASPRPQTQQAGSHPNIQNSGTRATHQHVHNRTTATRTHASEPRRQLNYANGLLAKLKHLIYHLDKLESDSNTSPETDVDMPEVDEATSSKSKENEDTDNDKPKESKEEESASSASTSTSNDQNTQTQTETPSTGHPKLAELHKANLELRELEKALKPHLDKYFEFLETDPSFDSTESDEYKATNTRLTLVLKAQRFLAEIYRVLSLACIPVSITPPRVMLIQAPITISANAHQVSGASRHPSSNVASAGTLLMRQPQQVIRRVVPQEPNMPQLRGVNVVRHVIPISMEVGTVGGGIPMGTISNQNTMRNAGLYNQYPQRQPEPHQTIISGRFPTPQRPNASRMIAQRPTIQSPRPIIARPTSQRPSLSTSTQNNSPQSSSANNTSSNNTSSLRGATVNVTANITPRININVMPYGSNLDDIGESNGGVEIDPSVANDDASGISVPNMPGVDSGTIQQIMQSINRTINQEMENGTLPAEVFGLEPTVSSSSFVVQGNDDENSVNDDLARTVGNTVQELLMHMTNRPSTSQSHTTEERNDQNSSNTMQTTGGEQTAGNGSATNETTDESASSEPMLTDDPSTNLAADLARQVLGNGGRFGSRPSSSSSSANSTVINRARASNENNSTDVQGMLSSVMMNSSSKFLGNLPKRQKVQVQSVPNCVNNLARQPGMPPYGADPNDSAIVQIFHYGGEFLTVQDSIGLVSGEFGNVNKICRPFRECLRKVFFAGKHPTHEQLQSLVEVESYGMYNTISAQLITEPIIEGIDAAASNVTLFRYFFMELLNILFNSAENNFAQSLHQHVVDATSLFVHLNMHLFRGGADAVTRYVSRELGGAMSALMGGGGASGGPENHMMDFVKNQLFSGFVPFARKNAKSYSDFGKFIVHLPIPLKNQLKAVQSDSTNVPSSSTEKQSAASSKEPKSQDKSKAKSGGSSDTGTAHVKQDAKPKGKERVLGKKTQEKDDMDWKDVVPKEWVEIINNDINKQTDMPPQEAFSEAYNSGMPASKRRKVVSLE